MKFIIFKVRIWITPEQILGKTDKVGEDQGKIESTMKLLDTKSKKKNLNFSVLNIFNSLFSFDFLCK